MTGLIFITCPSSPHNIKRLNLASTLLRNWEYLDGASNYYLVTSRNAYELEVDPLNPALVPISLEDNAWTGASISDIESYMLDISRVDEKQRPDTDAGLFLIIDDQGVTDGTAIILEHRYEDDEDADEVGAERVTGFNKVRVPWEEVNDIFVNLEIANMNFDEFCGGEDGDEDGWFEYEYESIGMDLSDENREVREVEIRRLREEGLIN
ncbi:hypothetical protein B0A48_06018 [Cryoendolithus antarcticus]|uniref:DUF6924 domain-containing protein n=1 Tax=Cryoendolithus antarcticus TaxID=1507870 RepID=A0A1V8TCL3_9PEZI|nr:hypothetical protein B0A48_06018 [Cryoendolithus antarcticus]